MNILIDIGHPAHVHMFKHFAHDMLAKKHKVLFTCRDKEFEIALLKKEGFEYVSFGKKYKSTLGKIMGILKFGYLEYMTAKKFRADIFLSHGSMYAAHASQLLGKPHIAFEDTFNFEQIRLYKPCTDVIFTSDYENPLSNDPKTISYAGYHELMYLHPNRFTPDKSILDDLGVNEGEKYVIIRFVAWNASHDIGHKGIAYENKIKAVELLSKYAKVFISAEGELPKELEQHRINISPEKIHDALAFASLVWGESFTIPAESSILAVPSVINHDTVSLYLLEQEQRYDLCYCFSESMVDQNKAIQKAVEIVKKDYTELKQEWRRKSLTLLQDKIDVTAFLVWFIENYPESKRIMKENPYYQYNFK